MAEAWTVLRLLQWTAQHLKARGVERARREAEDLLGHVLQLDRLKLYLQFDACPTPSELDAFRALVRRRAAREPLQYLLGFQEFLGLRLKVDRRALIPRPETEALAEAVLTEMGEALRGARAADLGTGSGCLALALLKAGAAEVWATDISPAALELAGENARALGLERGLKLLQGPDLEPLQGSFDLIVSNPPYVAEREREALQPEVRDFEPPQALFAGPDGREVLRRILAQAPARLAPGGLLALECGDGQAEGLREEFAGTYRRLWTLPDPFGKTRFLMGRS